MIQTIWTLIGLWAAVSLHRLVRAVQDVAGEIRKKGGGED